MSLVRWCWYNVLPSGWTGLPVAKLPRSIMSLRRHIFWGGLFDVRLSRFSFLTFLNYWLIYINMEHFASRYSHLERKKVHIDCWWSFSGKKVHIDWWWSFSVCVSSSYSFVTCHTVERPNTLFHGWRSLMLQSHRLGLSVSSLVCFTTCSMITR